jgi:hypothetical protein
MAIVRYEPVVINTVTNGISTVGTQTTTITKWFDGRARVRDVQNSVRISDRYRIYSDLVNLEFNYTPNMRTVVNLQQNYSITYRGNDWRITEAIESNDRMKVTLLCYRNDPSVPV